MASTLAWRADRSSPFSTYRVMNSSPRRIASPGGTPSRISSAATERARATAYFAALTIAERDPRRTSATSVAKAAAGDCQRLLGKEGIQIHGGIGYTWEHDLHFWLKRAKIGEYLLGTATTSSQGRDNATSPAPS